MRFFVVPFCLISPLTLSHIPRLSTSSISSEVATKGPMGAKVSQLFGQYVGETEGAIRDLFRRARERAPAIIFIDELDSLGANR